MSSYYEDRQRALKKKRRKQNTVDFLWLTAILVWFAAIAYFLFYGGVEQIINGAKASPVNINDLVWGPIRVVASLVVTFLTILGIIANLD